MKTTFLNTSILTSYGSFTYDSATVEEVLYHLQAAEQTNIPIESAVGHASTAAIMSDLLGREVPVNRCEYRQEPGDTAIVFKLRGRPPEGKILSREELEAIGYDFGILSRTR